MPIYEFRCNVCAAKSSAFFRSMRSDAQAACGRCGSPDTRRLFSTFKTKIPRSSADQLNKAELLDGVDYTNPASMANFFRKMGSAFDDEPNEHMDEIVGRLDHGEPVYKALDLDMGHSHGAAPEE